MKDPAMPSRGKKAAEKGQSAARPDGDGASRANGSLVQDGAARMPLEKGAVPVVEAGPEQVVTLRLYVAGQTPKSLTALANLRKVCDEHLAARYKIELEVIDLFEKPQLAQADQILAIPTLVRKLPSPIKKIIGDLSNTERVLLGLDINTKE